MNSEPDRRTLTDLLEAIACDSLDDEGWARLEVILLEDPEARAIYRRYMNTHIGLKQYLTASGMEPPAVSRPSPVLGFLGSGCHRVADFCWSGLPFSILVVIGLPLLCILFLVVGIRHPDLEPSHWPPAKPVCVARLSQTSNCMWAPEAQAPVDGELLTVGRRLDLMDGLAEITMANGTVIILQGPATLVVDSDLSVALNKGNLTARVPKPARGFTIQTPHLAVVDLGTEFGVRVEDDRDTAEIQVFLGKVQLESTSKKQAKRTVQRQLLAGHAVRIESNNRTGQLVIHDIAVDADRFVRTLPVAPAEKRSAPIILADFSDGQGTSEVGQFPGRAGLGWADAWRVAKVGGVATATSIERDRPLLDGGDYLRFLATRENDTAYVRTAVVRKLESNNRVDIKRPHVLTFDLRIDDLGQFDHPRDSLTICDNSRSHEELTSEPTGGWYIHMTGAGSKNGAPRNWTFYDGDGSGKSHIVDSGVRANEGRVYSFRVLVEPRARRWTPSIAIDGGRHTTFPAMRMRSSGTAEDRGYWPFLHFRTAFSGGNQGTDRERIEFSLDSIRITPAGNQDASFR